jgi:ferredoxin
MVKRHWKKRLMIWGISCLVVASLSATAAFALSWDSCRKVSGPCPYPGICGSYYDSNSNGICDFSEPAPEVKPLPEAVTSNETKPAADTAMATNPADVQSDLAPPSESAPEETPEVAVPAGTIPPSSPEPGEPGQPENLPETDTEAADTQGLALDAETGATGWTAFWSGPWLGVTILVLLLLAATLHKYFFTSPAVRWVLLISGALFLGFYSKCLLCPVGAVTSVGNFLTGRPFSYSIMAVLLLPILFTLFVGRIYCGSVCPMGAVQEMLHRVGRKLKIAGKPTGSPIIKFLLKGKYAVLFGVIVAGLVGGSAIFCNLDPFGFLFNRGGTIVAAVLLVGVLTWSVFSPRPWCRFVCPYGALLGIVNGLRHLAAKTMGGYLSPYIDPELCSGCRACHRKCPTRAISGNAIRYFECIDCGECTQACRKQAID